MFSFILSSTFWRLGIRRKRDRVHKALTLLRSWVKRVPLNKTQFLPSGEGAPKSGYNSAGVRRDIRHLLFPAASLHDLVLLQVSTSSPTSYHLLAT